MEKIKSLFLGVVVGFLCVVGGIILLGWNEANNVKNIKAVEEAKSVLVNVSSDVVDPNNEGKLVSTSGTMVVEDAELIDTEFNVKVSKTAKLIKIVEMYQWNETVIDNNGEISYSYEREWSNIAINSDAFEDKTKVNPKEFPYSDDSFYANKVMLGAYEISQLQKEFLETKAVVVLAEDVILPEGYTKQGEYITNATNVKTPAVGDIRISYKYNNDTEVSVLAMQTGNTFSSYVSKSGKNIDKIVSGVYTGEKMIQLVEEDNNVFKILFRVAGILLVMIGFGALLRPLLSVLSFIPLFGRPIAKFVWLIGMLIGLVISLIVIAISWIAFRPLIGISLLVGCLLLIALIVFLIKKNQTKEEPVNSTIVYSSNQISAESPLNNIFTSQVIENGIPQGATTLSEVNEGVNQSNDSNTNNNV